MTQPAYSHLYRRPTFIQTLREELRKVQSSAALLERQRNPGIGYWTSRSESTAVASSDSVNSSSSSPPAGRTSSDNARESPVKKEEEEVNLEYLRNVILQFLEHKEMRVSVIQPSYTEWLIL